MDYKEKYEQALERCKEEFNFNNLAYSHEEIKQKLKHVFPELKESEDERIRKEILNVFKQLDECTTICGRNYDYAKWIAWLEKQDPNRLEKEIELAYKTADEMQYKRGYEDAKREIESEDEQNSAEWGEEDENLLKLSLENLTELKHWFGEKYGKVGDCISWLKSLKQRMKGE